MGSGVAVNDSSIDLCREVGKHNLRYAVLKLSDDSKEIVVDEERKASTETGKDQSFFDGLIKGLPSDDCRYIIYDYVYDSSTDVAKLILVKWSPQGISIKNRMVYSSSKDALKRVIPDVVDFEADCPAALDHTDIVQKLRNA